MALTQVPPALLTSTTGTGTTVALSASPTFTGTVTTPGVTFSDSSVQTAAASPYVLKNRIINGDMRIDQRNAGASISVTGGFFVDRWLEYFSGGGIYSAQQSSTAPAGFVNSAVLTVTTIDSSIAAGDYYMIRHNIEGYNIADFNWGTANAKTITLSFWVQSSITGTYGGSLTNSAESRSYPFTYTISAANTWQQVSITIPGDTTGTWLTTNGRGIGINFGLGMGSTYSGTAGSWASSTYLSATGATNWIANSGATFYITGVQLEIGTSATPFERRLYNQELANCQRYTWNWNFQPSNSYIRFPTAYAGSTTQGTFILPFPVPMRIIPSLTYSGAQFAEVFITGGGATGTAISIGDGSTISQGQLVCTFSAGSFSSTAVLGIRINNNNTWTGIFSAEL